MDYEKEVMELYLKNPYSSCAEDLTRFYFFNYWNNTGEFPPKGGVHDRVHSTDWFQLGQHDCPGVKKINQLCKQLEKEIC